MTQIYRLISWIRPVALAVMVALALLGLGSCSSGLKSELQIAITTDIHYLAPDLHDDGQAFLRFVASGDGKELRHIDALLNALGRDLAAKPPDVLLITGDLTTNGEAASHRALAARLAKLEKSGIQVLVIPGNHDILNPWARSFKGEEQMPTESVSPEQFVNIYHDFGYGAARSRDTAGLSYLAAVSPKLWILMLDTALYLDNDELGKPQTGGILSSATLDWIKRQAQDAHAAGASLLVGMHHNLLDHSSVIASGFTLYNAAQVATLFDSLGIHLVLSGHIHIQEIAHKPMPGGTIYDIATNALSVFPNQIGHLIFSQTDRSFAYRTENVDVEGWARASGQIDLGLLEFEAGSAKAFRARSQTMGRKTLDAMAGLDPQRTEQAMTVLGTLNLRYFAGLQKLNAQDIAGSDGLKVLLGLQSGFLPRYAQSIMEDSGTDNNSLDLPGPAAAGP